MPIQLNNGLAQVNFSNYLHITVAKVASPGTIVWEQWFPTPFTSLNYIVPNLDPDMYYITYYEAATTSDLGTIYIQQTANGLTGLYETEYRYYVVDRGNTGDPVDGDTTLTDPYLLGKNIVAVHKRGFGPIDPATEYTYTQFADSFSLVGDVFVSSDTWTVEIKYRAGTVPSASGGGLYSGVVDITSANYTIAASDKNKLFRLAGTATSQAIILPPLASVPDGSTFMFNNSVGGTAVQPKISRAGTDVIKFTGMGTVNLTEIWAVTGETFTMGKVGSNWEVLTPYRTDVGQVFMSYLSTETGAIPMDGVTLYDGDELPRLWWWIQNRLPNDRYVVDDNVILSGYTNPTAATRGQFVVHSTLKKFRTPNMQGMVPKGIGSFGSPATGDKTGRYEAEDVKRHGHKVGTTGNQANVDPGRSLQRSATAQDPYASGSGTGYIQETGGDHNLVDNIGFVFHIKI